jgi:hypothetical protein
MPRFSISLMKRENSKAVLAAISLHRRALF